MGKVVFMLGWCYDAQLFDSAKEAVEYGLDRFKVQHRNSLHLYKPDEPESYYELDQRSIETADDIISGRTDVTGVLPQTFVRRFKPNGWTDSAFTIIAVREHKK